MFQDRSHFYASGQFNKADKWLYNAVDVNPCHLCALLLDRFQLSVITRLVKDGRRETSYLVSNRRGDESSLFSTLDITIFSESEPYLELSRRIIAFREGLLLLYIQLSHRCLQSW